MQQQLIIKKMKKDSTIDIEILDAISENLLKMKLLIFPIDGIYGFLSVYSEQNIQKCEKIFKNNSVKNRPVIVTNFNMLEQSAVITKKNYDFLRRVWPDEINVILNGNKYNAYPDKVEIRIPRFQFVLDLITQTGKPLLFYPLTGINGKMIFRKKEIIDKFTGCSDFIVYLNEWSHAHVYPTVIDISSNTLELIEKGKIALEEIQSLYFLDTSDEENL